MNWRSKLALAFISTVVSLALAETALRLTVDPDKKRLASYDKDLGWTGRPNGHGTYIRRAEGIRVPFKYNNVGFRDEDLFPKSVGTPRIALLGDSFVESLEVEFESSFHVLVQKRLRQRLHPDADVSILGSQGYSTAQQLLAFRKFAPTLNADVVLTMFYTGNDFEDNLRVRFAHLDEQGQLVVPINREPSWKSGIQRFKRWLFESSHLVYHLKNTIQSYAEVSVGDETKKLVERSDEYQFSLAEKLIVCTRDEAQNAGAAYGLVILPSRDEIRVGQSQRIKAVARICERHGIACVDLTPRLSIQHYFDQDIHFNEAGHIVVSRALFDFLIDRFARSLDPTRRNTASSM